MIRGLLGSVLATAMFFTGCAKKENSEPAANDNAPAAATETQTAAPVDAPIVEGAAIADEILDQDIAVAEDFEEEAANAITAKNMDTELEMLAKELAAEG